MIVYPWAPAQPQGLGTNPKAIAGLLRKIPGWFCVNVSLAHGPPLSRELEVELGVPTQLSGDLYYVLDRPPAPCRHPAVRLLSEIDVPLVQGAPAELREGGDIWVQRPAECVAAGGVVGGRLVGIMVAFAFSEKFAELGGATLEPFRQQGIGSAAAFLVSQELRARHRTPVWSTGEDYFRSQRVAEKLGFREFGRLNYVVVPRLKETGGFDPAHPLPGR